MLVCLLFKNINYLLISGNGYLIIFLFTESEDAMARITGANEADDKTPSLEQLNDKIAEEVEKEEAENVSTTEDSISESISAEPSEESFMKAE